MNGNILRKLRKEAGKTQTQTASELKITQQTYNGYEVGRRDPDIETLLKIADLFNVSVDHLLGRDTKKAPPTEQSLVGSSLLEKEQELLNIYRACDPGQQGQIRGYAQALLEEKQRQERRQA